MLRTILDTIVETKHRELVTRKAGRPQTELQEQVRYVDPPRDFFAAVATDSPHGIRLIAEVKKASPSAGEIVQDFDPVKIASTYHANGADAISVLTDETYFQGRLEFISQIKAVVPLPVLRKDFLVDEYQVWESRAHDADAILLIAEILESDALVRLRDVAAELSMTTLVEVHAAENLRRVIDVLGLPDRKSYILGINNRDLALQKTDLRTTERLASLLPAGAPFVAESGIATRDDVLTVQRAGASAMLVGESILRSSNHGSKIRELRGTE
ncbi:MAG: indole-3-glycerol phosphate synthase TrpC [Planctomycetes bacterium]|nr:indole-3-glycerol phosphate synthase TrpC [Planctomycetota bacterium]